MSNASTGGASTLPFSSNVNWAQFVGLAATLLALFGINLDPATQTAVVTAIVSLTAVATWVLHTFVNHPSNVQAAQALVTAAVSAAKKSAPAFAAFAFVAFAATGLGACSTLEDTAATLAADAVGSTPVPGQAKTVFGAELTFDFLVQEAQQYVDSGLASAAQKAAIHDAVVKASAVNQQTRKAAESGGNAASAALLASLNAANLDFAQALSALGVSTGS
jgi:hypothetical protein